MRLRLLFLLLPAVCPFPAWGQASLAGTVHTEDGLPLPQLVITLEGAGSSKRGVTGPDGRYRMASLPAGDYTIGVEAPGLSLDGDPRVSLSGETRRDLLLRPAPVHEQVLVAATRGEAAAAGLGTSVSVIDAERIAEREPSSFVDLLRELPGVSVARAGVTGQQASVFVRGGESSFARVLVDGVPVNEPGGFYNFASQFPLELGRVELVRGAASSLYGTDALAGVVQLVTRRAAPGTRPSLSAGLEAGAFATRRVQATTLGSASRLDWNAGLSYSKTDNEQPNSAFEQTAGAASVGLRISERSSLRAVLRGEASSAGTPGQTAFGRPDRDATSDHDELVAALSFRHARGGSLHELRAGFSRTGQLSKDPLDSGSYLPSYAGHSAPFASYDYPSALGYQNDTRRLALGYQVEARLGGSHLLTAGAEVEHEGGDIGERAGPLLSPVRTNAGLYLQDRVVLGRLSLTAGGRVERNDSYGTRAVPRVAAAWRLGPVTRATTLRASAGAGIKEPSFFQSFGVDEFALGNPDLRPERSRSYDAGAEQRLAHDRLRLEATLFQHDYLDQIAYRVLSFTPFRGSFENLGRTRARGLELAVEAAPRDGLRLLAQYTLLDGAVLVSTSDSPLYAVGQPLLRRPRHQGSLTASFAARRLSGGATLLMVGRRSDSDFLGLDLTENPGYARFDARLRAALGHGLEAFAVAENLLNRRYQEILGYPALGRGVRAGVRFRTGGEPRP